MRNEKVTCDGCGGDISTRWNSVDYRLVLQSESKPLADNLQYMADMMIYEPISRPHHFCRLGCLDTWRDRERMRGNLLKGWMDRWAEKHGSVNSSIRSYPVPPDDVIKERDAAIEAEVMIQYPFTAAE